jgi:hypothetical protein
LDKAEGRNPTGVSFGAQRCCFTDFLDPKMRGIYPFFKSPSWQA